MNESNKMEYTGNREDLISQGYESCGNCHSLCNTNPVKLGRCFSFLNNWYGFEHGGDRKSKEKVFTMKNSSDPKNQTELAESYGITKQTMNNYIRMANMIPELEDLIETNIRQRGIGNPNPIKLGRCIKELERIYGIKQGNGSNQYEQNPKLSDNAKTPQENLADMIGISVDTLNNYKKLTEMIPELEELVDTGITTPTTALAIIYSNNPSINH